MGTTTDDESKAKQHSTYTFLFLFLRRLSLVLYCTVLGGGWTKEDEQGKEATEQERRTQIRINFRVKLFLLFFFLLLLTFYLNE
jgi:hypothetical protein